MLCLEIGKKDYKFSCDFTVSYQNKVLLSIGMTRRNRHTFLYFLGFFLCCFFLLKNLFFQGSKNSGWTMAIRREDSFRI